MRRQDSPLDARRQINLLVSEVSKEVIGAGLSLWRQIQSLYDPCERNVGLPVHFFNNLGITSFKQAHAVRLARNECRSDVAHRLSVGRELIAGFDRGLLRGGQLFHFNAW